MNTFLRRFSFVLMLLAMLTSANVYGATHTYSVTVKTRLLDKPDGATGAGTVNVNHQNAPGAGNSETASVSFQSGKSPYTHYFNATPKAGYKFVKWVDSSGKTKSTDAAASWSIGKSWALSNQTYTETYYAVFESGAAVSATSDVHGTAVVIGDNTVGTSVTLRANPIPDQINNNGYISTYKSQFGFEKEFERWEYNGQIVSTDNPYTFTITDANKGAYKAKFRIPGYKFYRMKNAVTGRYVSCIGENTSVSTFNKNFTVLNSDNYLTDPASVWQFDGTHTNTMGTITWHGLVSQGVNSHTLLGTGFVLTYKAEDFTWLPNTNDGQTTIIDAGGTNDIKTGSTSDNSYWYIEPFDTDVSLPNGAGYLSLDPSKMVTVSDGVYMTTIRVPYNLKHSNNITAYYFRSGTNGNNKMEVIEGVIPAGIPVVLKSNTTDTSKNILIPTEEAAAEITDNVLVSSTKYFPNQAYGSTVYAMDLTDNKIFGATTTTVNGNEAYLPFTPTTGEDNNVIGEEKTISEFQLATIYTDIPFTMPAGMRGGIIVEDGDGIAVNYIYDAGSIVPAGTALLLNGVNGNCFLPMASAQAGARPEDNLLHGADAVDADGWTHVEGENVHYYILTTKTTKLGVKDVGFYYAAADGGRIKYQAGKAFLAKPYKNVAAVKSRLWFNDDTPTGISTPQVGVEANDAWYTLQGVKIGTRPTQNGVYIKNGKKVVIK